MPLPVVKSPNGRVTRVITSKEELEEYLAKGYKKVRTDQPATPTN